MSRFLLVALGLVACGGPVEETLVDELRIVAAIPSVAEAEPGSTVSLNTLIVRPDAGPVDVLMWMCTPTGPPGSPCLEASAGTTGGWMAVVRGAGLDASGEVTISPLLSAAVADGPVQVPTWFLACEPGLCPIIDQAEAALTNDDSDLPAVLADPSALLQGLPLTGVAATQRSVWVSSRPEAERNVHPVVASGPVDVLKGDTEIGAEFSLELEDSGPLIAYSYATAGGFAEASTDADVDGVTLTWFAPEEGEGAVDLYVVVQDAEGGEALWRGTAEIVR
ncbi:MAG: hypothetical protein AB8H79_00140 [Myxococcota bacterium]